MRQILLGLVAVCLLLSAGGVVAAQEGGLWGWGSNPAFSLGHNGNSGFQEQEEFIDVPFQAGCMSDVSAMAGSCFVRSDGTVWRLGLYNEDCEYLPEQVMAYDDVYGEVALANIVAVSSAGVDSQFHWMALASNGEVWTWGDNQYGQLGYSGSFPDWLARRIPNMTGIVEIAAGGNHCVALDRVGMRIWTWGRNDCGQLGIGQSDESAHPTPQYITLAWDETTPTAIGAGVSHTLVVGANEKVYACGDNSNGRLGVWAPGLGGSCVALTTVKEDYLLGDLEGVMAVAGGDGFSVAIVNSVQGTTVYAWGLSDEGQAGAGGGIQEYPVQISILGGGAILGVDQVVAGRRHAMARCGDIVWAWGWDGMGQLGAQAGGGSTDEAILVLLDDVQSIASGCSSDSSRAIAANPIVLSLTFDWDWAYCNTAVTTADRNKSVLTVSVVSDPGGSGTYEVDVMEAPTSNGSFGIESTASMWAWDFRSGRRPAPDVDAYYDFTVHVRNTTSHTQALVVQTGSLERRILADVDNDGSVTATDRFYLNRYLNGLSTPYTLRNYDFDGDGSVTACDLLAMNQVLNGINVP